MAAALYNRYRPHTFGQVVGQEHVTAALAQALASGRIHHAYLFSGPRGCGKTSSARILAASLNCVAGPTPTPCGSCEQCTAIRAGSSVDVVEIDAASHGAVEDTRDLRERANYVPASARYRVFVIDEAHMISAQGFNALLKIVEEPPPHVLFVFATTDPDKVLSTIRSRTFQYQFRLVPPTTLRDHLAWVCEQEGASVDPDVLPLVVRAGAGSVRDSLSVLDQLIAGGAVSVGAARALLGVTDTVLIDSAVEAVAARDAAALYGAVEAVASAGHDPRRFTQDLLERFRDLILLAAVPDAHDRGLLAGYAADQLVRMGRQAGLLGPADLSRCADLTHAGLLEMRGTASPRLLLELLCARLLLPAAGAPAVLARVERLERRADVLPPASATRPPTPPGVPTPPSPPASVPAGVAGLAVPAAPAAAPPAAAAPGAPRAAATGLDAEQLRLLWPQVLDAVKARRRTAHAIVSQHAEVVAVRGGEITLAFSREGIAKTFSSGGSAEVVIGALAEVVGGSWRISVVTGTPQSAAASDFAPGDAPAEEPDRPAGAPPAPPMPGPDPVGLVRQALGGTVISETET